VARCVRAIDDCVYALRPCLGDDVLDGKQQGGGDVMWLRNRTRVRSVMPARKVLVKLASDVSGNGTVTTTILAPVFRAT
jgi:hypothetical protein